MSANLRQASSRAVNASSVGRMQVGLEFKTERRGSQTITGLNGRNPCKALFRMDLVSKRAE